MNELNPYRSPNSSLRQCAPDHAPRARKFIWVIAYLYPLVAAICFYGSWIVAWITLGHRPRPSLDDPQEIGGAMDLAYFVSLLAIMTIPVLTPIGFWASFTCPIGTGRRIALRLALPFIYVAVCLTLWLVIKNDPGGVIYWWAD